MNTAPHKGCRGSPSLGGEAFLCGCSMSLSFYAKVLWKRLALKSALNPLQINTLSNLTPFLKVGRPSRSPQLSPPASNEPATPHPTPTPESFPQGPGRRTTLQTARGLQGLYSGRDRASAV